MNYDRAVTTADTRDLKFYDDKICDILIRKSYVKNANYIDIVLRGDTRISWWCLQAQTLFDIL